MLYSIYRTAYRVYSLLCNQFLAQVFVKGLGLMHNLWQFILCVEGMRTPISSFYYDPSLFLLLYCPGSHHSLTCMVVITDGSIIVDVSLVVHCCFIISDLLSHWLPLLHSCYPPAYISLCIAAFCREVRFFILYSPDMWGIFHVLLTWEMSYFLCYLYAYICGRFCIKVYTVRVGLCVPEQWTESRITVGVLRIV